MAEGRVRGDSTAAASQHAMEASAEAAPALAQLSPASKNRKRSAQKKESKLKKKEMDRDGFLQAKRDQQNARRKVLREQAAAAPVATAVVAVMYINRLFLQPLALSIIHVYSILVFDSHH